MKLELRKRLGEQAKLLLIAENDVESQLIDEVFGATVDRDGKISEVIGEARLSNSCDDHYLILQKG